MVRESNSEADIWWAAANNAPANGSPNYEMDEKCAAHVRVCCRQWWCQVGVFKMVLACGSLTACDACRASHAVVEHMYISLARAAAFALLQIVPLVQPWARACRTFLLNRERAVDYLNMLDRIYVFDGFAGWDPEVRLEATRTHVAGFVSVLRPCRRECPWLAAARVMTR